MKQWFADDRTRPVAENLVVCLALAGLCALVAIASPAWRTLTAPAALAQVGLAGILALYCLAASRKPAPRAEAAPAPA